MLANGPAFREDGAMDYESAGLLDDLTGRERQARIQLLDALVAQGFGEQELREAAAENRLMLLPVEQALGGVLSAAEVSRRSGVDADILLRVHRQLGLPQATAEDPVFSEADAAAAASIRQFLDAGLGDDALADISRVLGEGMARLAATVSASFADAFLEPGDTEDGVAMRFATIAEHLLPQLEPVLSAAFSAHLRESISRGMITRSELEQGTIAGAQDLVVCFADLVGFTRLGSQLEAQELGTVAGRLGELAAAVAGGQVRLVKTIGDAAMFVSRDPEAMVASALTLLERAQEDELPSLRAGIALGPTLQRAGDFYGNAVNLASRVTTAARPDSVLCTEEIRAAAPEAFAWSSAGPFRLKGIHGSTPLHRARRPATAEELAAEDGATSRKAGRPRRSASR